MKTSEDGRKLHMKGNHGCKECGFATVYEYGQRIYYCDHEGRAEGDLAVPDEDIWNISEGLIAKNKEAYEVLAK